MACRVCGGMAGVLGTGRPAAGRCSGATFVGLSGRHSAASWPATLPNRALQKTGAPCTFVLKQQRQCQRSRRCYAIFGIFCFRPSQITTPDNFTSSATWDNRCGLTSKPSPLLEQKLCIEHLLMCVFTVPSPRTSMA